MEVFLFIVFTMETEKSEVVNIDIDSSWRYVHSITQDAEDHTLIHPYTLVSLST